MTDYALHPLCTLFPRLAGAEFDALRDDIASNGLREPIVLHDGFILDGGNRYRACLDAHVKPSFVKFPGGSIGAFVLSANLHRRHLGAGQQAAIVASVQDWSQAQPRGGDRRSDDQSATLHLDSVKDRSATSGASERTQKMADKVAKTSPALAAQVGRGEISLPKAAKQIEQAKPASKIMPRPVPKSAKAKAADPAARIAELEEQLELAINERDEAHDTCRDLAIELEAYEKASESVEAAAKEIRTLNDKLRVAYSRCDQMMTTDGALKKQIVSLQRQVKAIQSKAGKPK